MDSNKLTGIGLILLGISALSSAITSFITTTGSYSLIMLAGMGISGLCLAGMGIGTLLGKYEVTTGTPSKRSTALVTAIAISAFAIGALVALN